VTHVNSRGHSFQTSHAVRHYSTTRELWDTPIFETDSFVVVPTVGSLVEGWLLVIPRDRILSFAQLPFSLFSELESLLHDVVRIVEETYGPVALFEHGPGIEASPAGCGVNYAHLHIVPTECDLRTGAQEIASNIEWCAMDSIKAICTKPSIGSDYWFLQQRYPGSTSYLGRLRDGNPPSQLFRQVIARDIGCANAYDWKQNLGEDMIAATVRSLAKISVAA
jgi:ATP adenylyltransferase